MKLSDQIVSSLQPGQNKLSPMFDDFKQWSEWLEFVETGVIELCVGRGVYKEMLEMYRRNPEIQKPSLFYSWMRGLFVTWSVTLVGRLVDDKRGTRSFVRLLRSIQQSSHRLRGSTTLRFTLPR
jgi:hypothetical protein